MNGNATNNRPTLKFIIFLLVLALCWYLGRVFHVDIETCREYFAGYPKVYAGILFVLAYVVATTLVWFGPKDVLRISAAILFGGMVSSVYVYIGEMIDSVIMFQLSRKLGRDYVAAKFRTKMGKIDRVRHDPSTFGIITWRINPLIPFRFIDLGYGLTNVSLRKYFFTVLIPSVFHVVWIQFAIAIMYEDFFRKIIEILNGFTFTGNKTQFQPLLSSLRAVILEFYDVHPMIIIMSLVYFMIVAIVTLAAVTRRKPGNSHGPA